MKKFYYLFSNEATPHDIQVLSGEEEKKLNIYNAIKNAERIDLGIPFNGKLVTATSIFLKIIRKNEQLFIQIDSPIPSSAGTVITNGKKFLITYKVDNIDCAFLTKAVAFIKESNAYVISFPSEIHRMQRRAFYRVSIPKAAMIYVVCEKDSRTIKCESVDISEGGIAFYSKNNEDFVVGEKYEISLLMPDGIVLQSELLIKNVVAVQKSFDKLFKVSGEFKSMDRKYKEIIARYVFCRQKEEILKQKGTI